MPFLKVCFGTFMFSFGPCAITIVLFCMLSVGCPGSFSCCCFCVRPLLVCCSDRLLFYSYSCTIITILRVYYYSTPLVLFCSSTIFPLLCLSTNFLFYVCCIDGGLMGPARLCPARPGSAQVGSTWLVCNYYIHLLPFYSFPTMRPLLFYSSTTVPLVYC